MRIEISACGMTGAAAIGGFQGDMSGFINDAESMISSFKAVKKETYNLSGGVGNLQDALDNIDARIQEEEIKKANAITIQNKTNDFLKLAARVDRQVATLVDQNKEEFYQENPWARPITDKGDAPWYEKVWDWLRGKGKKAVDKAKQAWEWTKDTAKKLWDGLVEWYEKNKLEIINWSVTILCTIGSIVAIALIPVTGGASIALVAGISALSGAIIAGTRNVTAQYAANGSLENFDWRSFGKDVGIAAVVGGATGALGSWMGGAISSAAANTSIGATLLNSSHTVVRVLTGATIGAGSEVVSGMATRGVATAVEEYLSTGSVDMGNVFASATDAQSIFFDLTIGGVTSGLAAKNNPIGREVSIDDLNKEILSSKPSHSRDPVKWITEENGRIFVDGNGVWTYQAADGVHVCYSDGLPDFKRAKLVKTKYNVEGGFDVRNHNVDINNAVRDTNLGGKGSGYTWHHYQDGFTLQLIESKYHKLFTHVGGFAIAKGK